MLNHDSIGTEHLLLGLIREGEGVAAKALQSLGIDLEITRKRVEEIVGKGQGAPSGHIPFGPRAKKVLELGHREALQLGHNYIGTEHILLGLIREGEGVGAQVLISQGAELTRVRQQVIRLLSGYQGKEAAETTRLDDVAKQVSQAAWGHWSAAPLPTFSLTEPQYHWLDLHRVDNDANITVRFDAILALEEGYATVGGEKKPCTYLTLTHGNISRVKESIAEIWGQNAEPSP